MVCIGWKLVLDQAMLADGPDAEVHSDMARLKVQKMAKIASFSAISFCSGRFNMNFTWDKQMSHKIILCVSSCA